MLRRCIDEPAEPLSLLHGPQAWGLPDQHLVDHAGEAVDIRSLIEVRDARRLLRTHITRRPDGEPAASQTLRACRAHRLGDAKVSHHGVPL